MQVHRAYVTIGDREQQKEKKAEREKTEKEKVKEMAVRELWKPHAQSIRFFEEVGKKCAPSESLARSDYTHYSSLKDLYSLGELRTIINDYVASRSLSNAHEPRYVHPDGLLLSVLAEPKSDEVIQYLKRDEAVNRLSERMQSWHEIVVEGKDPAIR